jgi:chromosome segregation ATPase
VAWRGREQQHRRNFDLWHEEDKARDPAATDHQIAVVKRAIDSFNQQRNDLIEKLDDFIYATLQRQKIAPAPDAPWNSETPGSIIDKLSIMSLKVFHMREQTERLDAAPEHIQKCRTRLATLTQQRDDLTTALQTLLNDLFSATKQMKLYRQFKMYNDPDSNPKIYGAKK